jgi:hypothetical protein
MARHDNNPDAPQRLRQAGDLAYVAAAEIERLNDEVVRLQRELARLREIVESQRAHAAIEAMTTGKVVSGDPS